jgi:hypothetical protein
MMGVDMQPMAEERKDCASHYDVYFIIASLHLSSSVFLLPLSDDVTSCIRRIDECDVIIIRGGWHLRL